MSESYSCSYSHIFSPRHLSSLVNHNSRRFWGRVWAYSGKERSFWLLFCFLVCAYMEPSMLYLVCPWSSIQDSRLDLTSDGSPWCFPPGHNMTRVWTWWRSRPKYCEHFWKSLKTNYYKSWPYTLACENSLLFHCELFNLANNLLSLKNYLSGVYLRVNLMYIDPYPLLSKVMFMWGLGVS